MIKTEAVGMEFLMADRVDDVYHDMTQRIEPAVLDDVWPFVRVPFTIDLVYDNIQFLEIYREMVFDD